MAPMALVTIFLGTFPMWTFCELSLHSRKLMPIAKTLRISEEPFVFEPASRTDAKKVLPLHKSKPVNGEHVVDDDAYLMQIHVSVMEAESVKTAERLAVSPAVPESHQSTDEGNMPPSESHASRTILLQQSPDEEYAWCIADPFTSPFLAGVSALVAMLAIAALIWWFAEPAAEPPVAADTGAKRVRMDALDGLRTLLVTYVIISHSSGHLPAILRPVLGIQNWSMQYFFVLSGFIMTHVSAGKVDVFDRHSASNLLSRRLARLAPVYMLALGCAFLEGVAGPNSARPLLAWPLQALFLQSLFPLPVCIVPGQQIWWWGNRYAHMSGNGTGWFTSAVVILAFAFPLLYNYRPRAQSGFALCSVALLFVVGLRSLPTLLYEHLPLTGGGGLHVYGFAPLRLLEFTAGILAACVCEAMPTNIAERWQGWGWFFDFTLIFSVAAALVLPLPLQGLGNVDPGGRQPPHGDFFLTGIFCLACIAARCAAEQAKATQVQSWPPQHLALRGILGPVLASPVLVSMAEYSFAAYILQGPLQFLPLMPEDWRVYTWPLHSVVCWVAGYAATVYVERPIRAAVERRIQGPLADRNLPEAHERHDACK